ncbi:MAG: DUF115 domain-containing protein [Deltaproteobacteria bacterium]|nr:DUF115 domain-containing protein [Deltaproteobacteria bacterium]
MSETSAQQDLFEMNWQALCEHRPALAAQLQSYKNQVKAQSESLGSFAGSESLSQGYKEALILICDGIGSADQISQVIQNCPASTEILVVEKNASRFLESFFHNDLRSCMAEDRFEFAIHLPAERFSVFFRDYLMANERLVLTDRLAHFYDEGSIKKEGAYYLAFAKGLQQAVIELRDVYLAPGEDNIRGLINLSENLDQLSSCADLSQFAGVYQGMAGVILSAGPSLNEHLSFLSKLKGKVVTACTDGALQAVLKSGLEPDFVVSMERVEETAALYSNLPSSFTAPLFCQPVIQPNLFREYKNKKVLCVRDATFGSWLNDKSLRLFLGSTVASMAYQILCTMGCSQIFLLGQDLAYDRDESGASHVQGIDQKVKEATMAIKESRHFCELEGNDGSPIASNQFWKKFKEDLQYLIQSHSVATFNVISASKGAQILGAHRLEPQDFWSTINNAEAGSLSKTLASQMKTTSPWADFNKEGLIQKTFLGLDKIKSAALRLDDEISRFQHHQRALTGNAEEIELYQKKFAVWEEGVKKCFSADGWVFQNFVQCFLIQSTYRSPPHVKIISAIGIELH